MDWQNPLSSLAAHGMRPFIATTRSLLDALDLSVLGAEPRVFLLEREEDRAFHEAYLLANALGFGDASLQMPNWVLVDCVLMQTAVVGLVLARERASPSLLKAFEDGGVDTGALSELPVSGQIAGLGLDGGTLTGFSLFSLRRYLPDAPPLGILTKALALQAYRAEGKKFVGISHYDNKALSMHGRFGLPMWIEQAAIPLHPRRDMALVYAMNVAFDMARLAAAPEAGRYDYLLSAGDREAKARIAADIAEGQRAVIVPPFQIETPEGLTLPIRMETN